MRLEKVVIGIDFEPESRAAARWAAQHLVPQGELTLVHCPEIPSVPHFLSDLLVPLQVTVAAARDEAKQRLETLADELRGCRIRTVTRPGRPADEIAELAHEVGADWVIVGPHRRRHALGTLLGSTAEQLVRLAYPPVLLARGLPVGAPLRVLTPVDGSPLTPLVLGWARFLAERFDCDLHALHVLHTQILERAALVSPDETPEKLEGRIEREAHRWLEEELVQAGARPGRAITHVAVGDPTSEILAAAQRIGADLIVIGSRGLGATGRALPGRVASSVLRAAACAALVVNHHFEPDEAQ